MFNTKKKDDGENQAVFSPCTVIHTVKKSSIIEWYLLVPTLSGKVSDRLFMMASCIDLVWENGDGLMVTMLFTKQLISKKM